MIRLNLKKLKERCLAPIEAFKKEGEVYNTRDGVLIYKDNNSKILAVAHLDSVQKYTHFDRVQIGNQTYIFNAQLDDRLGAYIILDLLPELGITPDVLLTEGEEMGRSTARFFRTDKQYNWMFSFDRMGTDVVMYSYFSQEYGELLKDYGFRTARGSFSDICFLEHLGVRGFNFGAGYYDNHDRLSHAILEHTVDMISAFTHFYRDNYDVRMEYKQPHSSWSELELCDICGDEIRFDDLILTEDDVFACPTCIRQFYDECIRCGEYFSDRNGSLCIACRLDEELQGEYDDFE